MPISAARGRGGEKKMPSVLVVHEDAGIRARLLDALARAGIAAASLTDLEGALDHPEVALVRVVLVDPVLLEQYEFDFRTQIGVRAGSNDITVIALVAIADPARKKHLKRHEAILLERSIDDEGALVALVAKHSAPVPGAPPADPATDPGGRRNTPASLGRVNVERIQLDDGSLNAPVQPGVEPPMVLVVEDDEASRGFFATLLEQRGYRVHAVSSATSALRFLSRDDTVKLIVSDIDMPQMDGFELKYALKESKIPFIAVAGIDSPDRQQLAKELGMVALVGKPVQVKPFCELVRGAVLPT